MYIDIIRKLLDSSAVIVPTDDSGVLEIRLKETDPKAKLRLVQIRGVPKNTLLIKVDGAAPLNALLSAEKGIRQRCDYVLLTEKKNAPVLIYCEMKSTSVSSSEVTRQFKGGVCIVQYFNSLMREFLGVSNFFDDRKEVCFVAFSKVKGWKRTTLKHGIALRSTAEKFCKCPSAHVLLKELIG